MKIGLVSVVVPVYNAETTIEKCIRSIQNQTYKNIEIIVVNDGSIDNTLSICKNLQIDDTRIYIINQNNYGPSKARNNGIDASNGEFVIFVDSDDWIEKECIEIAVNTAIIENADIVLWNLIFEKNNKSMINTPLKGSKRIIEKKEKTNIINMMLCYKSENENMSNLSITGPVCKLFRKNCLNTCRFPENLNLGEDMVFLIDLIPSINKIVYLNEYFYHVNVRYNSLSHSFSEDYPMRKAEFVNTVLQEIAHININFQFIDKFIYNNYLTVVESCLFYSNKANYKQKIKLIQNFTESIDRKVDYKNIKHKCAIFLKFKFYLPIYIIGKLSRKY